MPTHRSPRQMRLPAWLALSFALCTAATAQAQQRPQRDVCPMRIPRTQLTARDFEGGTALLFVSNRNLTALRQRVEALAERHNRQAVAGNSDLPAVASVQDLDRGAALTFTWVDVGSKRAVATDVMAYAQELAGPDCPILRDTSPDEDALRPMSPSTAPMPGGTVPNMSPGISGPPVGGTPPTISW